MTLLRWMRNAVQRRARTWTTIWPGDAWKVPRWLWERTLHLERLGPDQYYIFKGYCRMYREVATDGQLGVEMELPEEIRDYLDPVEP